MLEKHPISFYEREWLQRINSSHYLWDTQVLTEVERDRGIYLAHAFTNLLTDGKIHEDNWMRRSLELLMENLRTNNFGVHCSLEREKWGEHLMPQTAFQLDFDQIAKAKMLVTFPQNSTGAMVEIGAALSQKIPMTIIWRGEEFPSPYDSGGSIISIVAFQRLSGIPGDFILDRTRTVEDFQDHTLPLILQSAQRLSVIDF